MVVVANVAFKAAQKKSFGIVFADRTAARNGVMFTVVKNLHERVVSVDHTGVYAHATSRDAAITHIDLDSVVRMVALSNAALPDVSKIPIELAYVDRIWIVMNCNDSKWIVLN